MEKILEKYPIIKQLFKFGIVGVIATIVDNGLYWTLTERTLHLKDKITTVFSYSFSSLYLAITISFLIAFTVAFILNKFWTFQSRSKRTLSQSIKSLSVRTIGYFLTLLITGGFVKFFGIDYHFIGKLLATVVVMVTNFVGDKFWSFKE
ncbi:hypothetical protein COY23_01755 [bacterium (Candidatus Torokbacteria) CG_4_10_14_0_2_um_filter_35_8]|nr:MAG: hypothetical protein COY23_01755 [bacterium (Candidatus Torokbacteria) CG_4_10_14_0_2_um_filter_35_8]